MRPPLEGRPGLRSGWLCPPYVAVGVCVCVCVCVSVCALATSARCTHQWDDRIGTIKDAAAGVALLSEVCAYGVAIAVMLHNMHHDNYRDFLRL